MTEIVLLSGHHTVCGVITVHDLTPVEGDDCNTCLHDEANVKQT